MEMLALIAPAKQVGRPEREREREKEREREREIAPVGERNGWLTDFREERERERFP